MHHGADLLINRQMQTYKSALRNWALQVARQQSPVEAFRIAAGRPAAGSLISSIRHLAQSEISGAERDVEAALQGHIVLLNIDHPQFDIIMRLTQGHWPRLYRELQRKLSKGGESS